MKKRKRAIKRPSVRKGAKRRKRKAPSNLVRSTNRKQAMGEEYLTPSELCRRYKNKVTEKTLAHWRSAGTGPKFSRLGGRIMYPVTEVVKWEQSRTVQSTQDYSAA